MNCPPPKSTQAAQKWACDKLNKPVQSSSCSLVHHDQGPSKTLRGEPGVGRSSQVSYCRPLRTWVTHVSWHNGSDGFPLTLITPLFDFVNYADSYFLYLRTGVKWGCDQPLADPATSSWRVQVRCAPLPTYPQLHHRFQPHHVFLHWISEL